jgi:predicted nucleic acid-binding Zn ribbon protein
MRHLKQRFCSKSCAQNVVWGDRKVKPKPCLHCGTVFRGVNVEAKFCSPDCHTDYRREHGSLARLPERHCDVCKAIFRPKSANARLCSAACANTAKVAYNRMKREEKRAEWQKPTPCQWCSETFTPIAPSNVFCGKQCNDRAQKAKKRAGREASTFICEEVMKAA